MELADLRRSIERIQNPDHDPPGNSRDATYLRTYPSIVAFGTQAGEPDSSFLHRMALMTYGWMPRVLRLDPVYITSALLALKAAKEVTLDDWGRLAIQDLADCLSSIVGASKVLHFVNPEVFPIWDSRIEGFRRGGRVNQYHMNQLQNYLLYVREIQSLTQTDGFAVLHLALSEAFKRRLKALGITPYPLTKVRGIELAMFEIAGTPGEG